MTYRESSLSATITTAQPWTNMGTATWQNARFYEYKNTGSGATKNSNRTQLTDAQAANYTPQKYLAGTDGWNPIPTTVAAPAVTVYVAGDSTASTYVAAHKPRTGWGQALPVFLTPNATVVDVAKSGASSKSFIDLGRLDHILGLISSGDYLLISFGHNDEKANDPTRYTIPATTYKSYLSQYIDKARAKGAIPILVTPVERRKFNSAGVAITSPRTVSGRDARARRGEERSAGRPERVQPGAVEQARRRGHQEVLPLPDRPGRAPTTPRGRGQHALPGTRRDRGGPADRYGTEEPGRPASRGLPSLTTANIPDSKIVWPTTAPY